MLALLVLLMALLIAPAHSAEPYIPTQAYTLAPQLRSIQVQTWPDAPMPSFMAAQVEQESCISLTHSKCWNPRAQLKTSREWGYGLGQTTIAYRADGSVRFNKQAELRAEYASLRGWSDDDKFNPHYQLLALVEMDHGIYRRVAGAATTRERLAFTLSAYNGGESGVRQDRVLCGNTLGCDRSKWFGNVEKYSLKTRKVNPGYGASAYQINREYVRNVIDVRRPKYERFFDAGLTHD